MYLNVVPDRITGFRNYNGNNVAGPLMCELYGMSGSLCGCASIWTMTMIALDRYNVIVKVKSEHIPKSFLICPSTQLMSCMSVPC